MPHAKPTGSEADAIYAAKMAAIPTIFILVAFAAAMPFILRRIRKARNVIVFLVCFSAGAMLGIGLLHMIPESREVWEAYFEEGHEHDHDHDHDHVHNPANMTAAAIAPSTVSSFLTTATVAMANAPAASVVAPSSIRPPRTRTIRSSSRRQRSSRSSRASRVASSVADGSVTLKETRAGNGPLTHGGGDHEEPYPYTEMLSGATVILLVAVEYLLMRYLQRRGAYKHEHGGHDHGGAGDDHSHHHGDDERYRSLVKDTNHARVNTSASGKKGNTTTSLLDGNDNQVALTVSMDSDAMRDAQLNSEDDADNGEIEEREPEMDAATKADIETKKRHIDAYISALAICVHCLFNGLSLGADGSSSAQFWAFFSATIGHKFMDGFAIGVPIYRAQLPRWLTIIIISTVAASTPLGIVIGYTVSNANESHLARAIVMSLSTGSFIFVALFELMPAALRSTRWLLTKLFVVALGYTAMAVVAKWA